MNRTVNPHGTARQPFNARLAHTNLPTASQRLMIFPLWAAAAQKKRMDSFMPHLLWFDLRGASEMRPQSYNDTRFALMKNKLCWKILLLTYYIIQLRWYDKVGSLCPWKRLKVLHRRFVAPADFSLRSAILRSADFYEVLLASSSHNHRANNMVIL